MLFILLGVFIVCAVFFGVMQSVNGDSYDDGFAIMCMVFIILTIIIFLLLCLL